MDTFLSWRHSDRPFCKLHLAPLSMPVTNVKADQAHCAMAGYSWASCWPIPEPETYSF